MARPRKAAAAASGLSSFVFNESENFITAAQDLLDNLPESAQDRADALQKLENKKYFTQTRKSRDALVLANQLSNKIFQTTNSSFILKIFTKQFLELLARGDNNAIFNADKMLLELCNCGFSAKEFSAKNKQDIYKLLDNLNDKLSANSYNEPLIGLTASALSHIKNLGLLDEYDKAKLNNILQKVAQLALDKELKDVEFNSLHMIGVYCRDFLHVKLPADFEDLMVRQPVNFHPRTSRIQRKIYDQLTHYLRKSQVSQEGWTYTGFEGEDKSNLIDIADGKYFIALDQQFEDSVLDCADIVVFAIDENGQRENLLVIEVDGAHHYANIDGETVITGRTQARDKMRSALQDHFIKIPLDDFNKFERHNTAQDYFSAKEYIKNLRIEIAGGEKMPRLSKTVPVAQAAEVQQDKTSSKKAAAKKKGKKSSEILRELVQADKSPKDRKHDMVAFKYFLEKYPYKTYPDLYRNQLFDRGDKEFGTAHKINFLQLLVQDGHVDLCLMLLHQGLPQDIIATVSNTNFSISIDHLALIAILGKCIPRFNSEENPNKSVGSVLRSPIYKDTTKAMTYLLVQKDNQGRSAMNALVADIKYCDTALVITKLSCFNTREIIDLLPDIVMFGSCEVLQYVLFGHNVNSYGDSLMECAGLSGEETRQKFHQYIAEVFTSCLMAAVQEGRIEMIDLLLQKGADVNSYASSSETPLSYACLLGKLDVVQHLVENCHADIEKPAQGIKALTLARNSGKLDIAEYLLNKGAQDELLRESQVEVLAAALTNPSSSVLDDHIDRSLEGQHL